MDGAKDTKVRSEISSTIKLAKNSLLSIAEDAEVGGNGDSSDDKTVKKSPLLKKANVTTEYVTSLCSKNKIGFP